MVARDDEFQKNERLAADRRRKQDRHDFGNETAGREVGRIGRFLPESARPDTVRAKQARDADRLSRLAMLMQNAEYAALYGETRKLVLDYGMKAEAGLEAAQSALSASGRTLENITDRSAKLHPSGAPVFRDENGNAVSANGTRLSPEDAASVMWPDDVPTYEEYRDARTAYAEAQARVETWQHYQLFLGDVQNRLNHTANPPSPEELEEIQQIIRDRLPETSQKAGNQQTLIADGASASVDKPRL